VGLHKGQRLRAESAAALIAKKGLTDAIGGMLVFIRLVKPKCPVKI
jgi:hypothetical protein